MADIISNSRCIHGQSECDVVAGKACCPGPHQPAAQQGLSFHCCPADGINIASHLPRVSSAAHQPPPMPSMRLRRLMMTLQTLALMIGILMGLPRPVLSFKAAMSNVKGGARDDPAAVKAAGGRGGSRTFPTADVAAAGAGAGAATAAAHHLNMRHLIQENQPAAKLGSTLPESQEGTNAEEIAAKAAAADISEMSRRSSKRGSEGAVNEAPVVKSTGNQILKPYSSRRRHINNVVHNNGVQRFSTECSKCIKNLIVFGDSISDAGKNGEVPLPV